MTEAELQRGVVELAAMVGWRCNHTRTAVGKGGQHTTPTSTVGFPDLFFWRPAADDGYPRHMLAELKTNRGQLSVDQRAVIESLRAAGLPVYVWRPRDWDSGVIEQTLIAHSYQWSRP